MPTNDRSSSSVLFHLKHMRTWYIIIRASVSNWFGMLYCAIKLKNLDRRKRKSNPIQPNLDITKKNLYSILLLLLKLNFYKKLHFTFDRNGYWYTVHSVLLILFRSHLFIDYNITFSLAVLRFTKSVNIINRHFDPFRSFFYLLFTTYFEFNSENVI